ncbi:MAG: T9SS type A sorting domain-containing protein [Ignavibacteria bacterium]|nr:T9SS type A sorting domain-containing protein [Ignavibacteria bacterium]
MKKLTFLVCFLFLITGLSLAQTNSVVLKDSSGTVIGQYNNIQSAYNAIPATITMPYIIEILAIYDCSLETYPISFTQRTGSSAVNTVTLRPAAGNTGEIITGTSTVNILNLEGADYIIIDGRPGGVGTTPDLKIENLATGSGSNTVVLQNGATHNLIHYVHIINNSQNTAGPRALVFNTAASGPVGNSNNLVTRCKIEGGRSGIGSPGTTAYPNDSNTVSYCEIFNWNYAGIWLLSGTMNFNVENNVFYQTVGYNNTIVSGIIMSTMTGATYNIKKNKFNNLLTASSSSSTIRGIYAAGPAAGCTFNIENNFVSNMQDNLNAQTMTGIELLGSNAYTANVYYNSVRIGGNHSGGTAGATTSAGIRIGASALTLNMKNNIAVNTRTGGNVNHIGFALTSTGGTLNIDYNSYYSSSVTNGYNAWWGTVGYNNISDYKTAATPNEQNTVFHNVTFVDSVNLHLAGSSIGDTLLKGTPIAGITTDIDDEIRNSIAPYKGADEANIPLFITKNTNNPVDYSLSQNYPNPFNPSTTIKFSIAKEGYVTLKIYNILGKEVAVLLNQKMGAGEYQYQYLANGLSSGIYFYELVSGNFRETKRMILVK